MLCSLLGHFGLLRSRYANGGGSEKDLLGITAVKKRGVRSDQGAQVTRSDTGLTPVKREVGERKIG